VRHTGHLTRNTKWCFPN